MKTKKQIVECVPNISEGQDQSKIKQIKKTITKNKKIKLLNIDTGKAANRTVFTFIGEAEEIKKTIIQLYKICYKLIDMRKHKGVHPRIGAIDVCPIIPVKNISISECIILSKKIARELEKYLDIPIYMYSKSAIKEENRNLPTIRKGEYENFQQKMESGFLPDYGSKTFNKKFGATVIGARNFMIAYNINLKSRDLETAKKIANQIRTSGNAKEKLPYCQAKAWFIKEFDCVQITTNLHNFQKTNIHTVFEKVKTLAKNYNIETNGSEIVGLIPEESLKLACKYYNLNKKQTIKKLGLNSVKKFSIKKQILENKF